MSPVDRKHARDNRPDMGGAWSSAREVILAGPGWDGSQSSVLCLQWSEIEIVGCSNRCEDAVIVSGQAKTMCTLSSPLRRLDVQKGEDRADPRFRIDGTLSSTRQRPKHTAVEVLLCLRLRYDNKPRLQFVLIRNIHFQTLHWSFKALSGSRRTSRPSLREMKPREPLKRLLPYS